MSRTLSKESDTVRPACAEGGAHDSRPDSVRAGDSAVASAGHTGSQLGRAVSLSFKPLDKDGLIEKSRRNLPHWNVTQASPPVIEAGPQAGKAAFEAQAGRLCHIEP